MASRLLSPSPLDLEQVQERPRKRARVSSRSTTSTCRRILLEEVDLEIALQERLAATVQSRITWALLLQEALRNDLSSTGTSSSGFQDAALDALAAVEAPCNVLFTREIQPVTVPSPLSTTPSLITAPTERPQAQSVYSTRTRGLHRSTRPPVRKLLFLRNTAKFLPQIVKLACPDCQRTDFSSLQGLLNHCRLGHKREFGSHDDCVQSCAVLVEDETERAFVVENGTEVGGISLPGLRRLFELAVGGGQGLLPMPILPANKEPRLDTPSTAKSPEEVSQGSPLPVEDKGSHVVRGLGVHIDTPALAPFLGRAPKKRCINVYDDDQNVDIFACDRPSQRPKWRMTFTHRSKERHNLDEVIEPPLARSSLLPDYSNLPKEPPSSVIPSSIRSTRFHIIARVSIQDISLWIPSERREDSQQELTHRWRLAVTSPTYSLPLHSFLSKLTIMCLTDPPPPTLTAPIAITAAPFVYTGLTDRPFLVRLTFTWTGSEGQNPPTEVDHLVELDPSQSDRSARGEEQFFDIELDRNTALLPVNTSLQNEEDLFNLEDTSESPSTRKVVSRKEDDAQKPDQATASDYAVKLKSLLPQVPMTLKDIKGRLSRQPPYILVSTTAQFCKLVYGRRKALEWARARALKELYDELCASTKPSDGQNHMPLTVVDVLHWLEEEGLFPRSVSLRPPSSTPVVSRSEQTVQSEPGVSELELYCSYCGLHYSLHPEASRLDEYGVTSIVATDEIEIQRTALAVPRIPASPFCTSFNGRTAELPPVDVSKLLAVRNYSWSHAGGQPGRLDETQQVLDETNMLSHTLVTAANPDLVIAIRELRAKWTLPTFPTASYLAAPGEHSTPQGQLCKPKDDTERCLAPYALLSLALQPLMTALILNAVEECHRDDAGTRALPVNLRQQTRRNNQCKRLLTPSHVLRGLLHEAPRSAIASTLLNTFAPLGISLPNAPNETAEYEAAED